MFGNKFAAAAAASASLPLAQPRRFVKYYMQRVQADASHVLFYVVDEAGIGQLAVLGTDVKGTGHFVYSSVLADAPALRCTNRAKVIDWLRDMGIYESAEDHEVTLPSLPLHLWQQLHTNSPLMVKPQLDREYHSWRDESGNLPDGRHFKHFILVDTQTGHERLAVVGEDSVRADRRYSYKAVDDLGGFCFENGKMVTDWLDFVVGRSDRPPAVPERKRPGRKKKGAAAAAAAQQDDTDGQDTDGGGRTSGSGMMFSNPPYAAAERPPSRYGSGANLLLPPLAPGPSAAGAGTEPLPFANQFEPTPRHYQPPQPSAGGGGRGAGALQPPSGGPQRPYLPPAGQQQQQLGGPPPPAHNNTQQVDMQAAVLAAGEDVRQLFSVGGPTLLQFVTHVPDAQATAIVQEMSRRLHAFVAALGLTSGLAGSTTITTDKILDILNHLAERPASLKLLETTDIAYPVGLLADMHYVLAKQGQRLRDEAVRDLAPVQHLSLRLAKSWGDLARTAHQLSSQALTDGIDVDRIQQQQLY